MVLKIIQMIMRGNFNMSENKLDIPEFKLEDLLEDFEGYQNHIEWDEIPLVGEEL